MDRLVELKKLLLHPFCYLLCGGALCFLALCSYLFSSNNLELLESRAITLKAKKEAAIYKKNTEEKILKQLRKANRVYVEEVLEKMPLLKPEIAKLQALTHSNPNKQEYKERLDFLTSDKNTLRFKEQNFQRLRNLQEVEVIQSHPVEVNTSDLKYLLSQIENVPLGEAIPEKDPPYFLIKQFDLIKKPHSTNEETFLLNIQMTKQEIVNE